MQNKIDRANRGYKIVTLAVIVATAFSLDAWPYHGHAAQAYDTRKAEKPAARTDWTTYNGGVMGDHYSPLDQITTANANTVNFVFGCVGQPPPA